MLPKTECIKAIASQEPSPRRLSTGKYGGAHNPATVGLSFAFFLWIGSLVYFSSLELYSCKKGASLDRSYNAWIHGLKAFGVGLICLSGSLTYLTMYIALFLQLGAPSFSSLMWLVLISLLVASTIGIIYWREIIHETWAGIIYIRTFNLDFLAQLDK